MWNSLIGRALVMSLVMLTTLLATNIPTHTHSGMMEGGTKKRSNSIKEKLNINKRGDITQQEHVLLKVMLINALFCQTSGQGQLRELTLVSLYYTNPTPHSSLKLDFREGVKNKK